MFKPLFEIIPKHILDKRVDLSTLYGYEYSPAFYLKEALEIIDVLTLHNIAILGGDVYHINNGKVTFGNGMDENWSTEFKDEESYLDYLSRASLNAKNYIIEHVNSKDYIYNFVLADANAFNELRNNCSLPK
jgi:hypothetical protein